MHTCIYVTLSHRHVHNHDQYPYSNSITVCLSSCNIYEFRLKDTCCWYIQDQTSCNKADLLINQHNKIIIQNHLITYLCHWLVEKYIYCGFVFWPTIQFPNDVQLPTTVKSVTPRLYMWLDLQKPSSYTQELKFILLLIITATLKDYPDTVTQLL